MTDTFGKAAWSHYIDSEEVYYGLPLLETQDVLLKPWRDPAQSVGVEVNAEVAPNVDESRIDAVPKDDDDRNYEGAVGLDEMDRFGVKRRIRDLQKSCRVKLPKVPGTVADAVELADELAKQVVNPEHRWLTMLHPCRNLRWRPKSRIPFC